MTLPRLKHSRMWLFAGLVGISNMAATHFLPDYHADRLFVASAHAEEAEDTLSQDVGKSLQQAQTALAAHQMAKAMSFVNAANAVSTKSAYDTYVIAQMRAAVASQMGNVPVALKAYDMLINNERTQDDARKQMLLAQASMAYTARNYAASAQAAAHYLKLAGPDQKIQSLLLQDYYLQQDWQHLISAGREILAENHKTHQQPLENHLQMLATAYDKLHEMSGKADMYVQLVKYYPRTQYWQLLIHDLTTDTSLTPRMVFNLQRLRFVTGLLNSPEELQDMAERAIQMGLPQLALKLLDEGAHRHHLGSGTDANAQARFHTFVEEQAAQAREGLANAVAQAKASPKAGPSLTAGYNLVLNGQVAQGLHLMQQGLAKKPEHPDMARLNLGMALMDAGHHAEAVRLFSRMDGSGTANDLAQLWALHLASKAAAH